MIALQLPEPAIQLELKPTQPEPAVLTAVQVRLAKLLGLERPALAAGARRQP